MHGLNPPDWTPSDWCGIRLYVTKRPASRNPFPSCPSVCRGVTTLLAAVLACASPAGAGNTNNILITGYWPPTNEMLREFSQNPAQNPTWIGRNWEGRGFDVHAFFPEFPGQTGPNWGRGSGDFEVDYQDTTADWARIVAGIKPVAIITFSRANTTVGWELEPAARRWRLQTDVGTTPSLYVSDYLAPLRPEGLPIGLEPIGNVRLSSLPMQAIVNAVAAQMSPTQADPFIPAWNPANPNDPYDFGGGFLSGYIAYLGCWHRDLNVQPTAQFRCVAAGHIHVGTNMTVANGRTAAKISLRELIAFVNTQVSICRADWDDDGVLNTFDIFGFLNSWFTGDGDFNGQGGSDIADVFEFLNAWFAGCA